MPLQVLGQLSHWRSASDSCPAAGKATPVPFYSQGLLQKARRDLLPPVLHGLRRSLPVLPRNAMGSRTSGLRAQRSDPWCDKAHPWGHPGPRADTSLLSSPTSFPGAKHALELGCVCLLSNSHRTDTLN